ncbi:MAG TPA: Dabb family protein [Terriglobia bacterium]|nr:Dabb family protein [Terriglobia bacterium]
MIRHIVMWRLKDTPNKAANAVRIKQLLESLRDRIPGLVKIEVGIDTGGEETSADVVLLSEFTDAAALETYQRHPLHMQMKPEIGKMTAERRVVDHIVDAPQS